MILFCFFLQYGRQALELCLKSMVGLEKPNVSSPEYNQDFFDGKHTYCFIVICKKILFFSCS